MPKCEGVIAEVTRPMHSEMVLVSAEGESEQYERVIHYETIAERRCEAEATTVSRSMREVRCDVGELHWVPVEDRHYCRPCFKPGRMEHLDGRVTQHPVMAIADA